MSKRQDYKVIVEFTVQLDDESIKSVERLISEHVSMMYAKMERESDIRIILQHRLGVKEF
jgi:hypothetical protein